MAAGRAGKHAQVAPHIPEADPVEENVAPEATLVRSAPRAGRLMCVACGTVVEAPSP